MAPRNNRALVERFVDFYEEQHRENNRDLAGGDVDDQESLVIDWNELSDFDPDLANEFLEEPERVQKDAKEALRLTDPTGDGFEDVQVRVTNLAETTSVSELRSEHLHSLVSVYGTVIQVTEVRSRPETVAWECQRCGTLTYAPQPEHVRSLAAGEEPAECQGCEGEGPFRPNSSRSSFQDAQSAVLREPLEGAGTEDSRASILVELDDDQTGELSVGDHIHVTGVLNLADGDRDIAGSLPDKYLDARAYTHSRANDHIILTEDDKQSIIELSQRDGLFEELVASIAPTIEGYEQVKLALLLQLFSGVKKELPGDREIRGDSHVLLVGDPGTAKSVLARQTARLAPRAALVDGSDASAAGLTSAAAVSSNSTGGDPWMIEGGIIAMANEGVACIDNFDQLRSEAHDALHGVLEHQEINASKATVKRSIPAETSVLATANPKYGRFDQYEPIADQVDFPPGLLSEFDLLFAITDQPDPEQDAEVADRILETQYSGELAAQGNEHTSPVESTNDVDDALAEVTPPIDHDLLRKYIAYARRNCFPAMTQDAKETIKEFYVNLRERGMDEDAPVPLSARKLEAVVRFAEASARGRLSETIARADADRVIEIVRASMRDISIDPETGNLDADVVETGTSKSQRERIKNLQSIIEDLENQYAEGASIEEVIERLRKLGMSRSKAEQELTNSR